MSGWLNVVNFIKAAGNPNHDPHDGKFTSGGGSGGGEQSDSHPAVSVVQQPVKRPAVSEEESAMALADYKESEEEGGFQAINNALRSGSGKHSETIRRIDEGFNYFGQNSSKRQLVYRGVEKFEAVDNLKVGDILTDKAFVSTTQNKSVAEEFAHSGGYLLEITIPAGANYIDMESIEGFDQSKMHEESELLLERNAQFKVTGRSGKRIQMEYIW